MAIERADLLADAVRDAEQGHIVPVTEHGHQLAYLIPTVEGLGEDARGELWRNLADAVAAGKITSDPDEIRLLLEALEDLEDLVAARVSLKDMEETGQKSIPWEQVKADLDLD